VVAITNPHVPFFTADNRTCDGISPSSASFSGPRLPLWRDHTDLNRPNAAGRSSYFRLRSIVVVAVVVAPQNSGCLPIARCGNHLWHDLISPRAFSILSVRFSVLDCTLVQHCKGEMRPSEDASVATTILHLSRFDAPSSALSPFRYGC